MSMKIMLMRWTQIMKRFLTIFIYIKNFKDILMFFTTFLKYFDLYFLILVRLFRKGYFISTKSLLRN